MVGEIPSLKRSSTEASERKAVSQGASQLKGDSLATIDGAGSSESPIHPITREGLSYDPIHHTLN